MFDKHNIENTAGLQPYELTTIKDDSNDIPVLSGYVFGSTVDNKTRANDIIWKKNTIYNFNHKGGPNQYNVVSNTNFEWEIGKYKPDHSRHIFTNMDAQITCLNRHNIAQQIRHKDIDIKLISNNHDIVFENDGYGVFVIDDYIHYGEMGCDLGNIIRYYRNNHEDKKKLSDNIKLIVTNTINSIELCGNNNKFEFRVITYIPQSDLDSNGILYSPEVDLVFSRIIVSSELLHPESEKRMDKRHDRNLNKDFSCVMAIDYITDDSKAKPLYYTLGGKVQNMISTYKPNIKPGIYFSLFKKGVLFDKGIKPIDQCEEIGFYRSNKEAADSGNLAKHIEIKKLNLEEQRIEQSSKEIEFKSKELEHKYEELKIRANELENSLLKMKGEKEKLELESKKRIEEYIIFREKYKLDKAMLEYKYKHDKEKLKLEIRAIKFKQDYETRKQDIEISLLLFKEELNIQKEIFKNGLDINANNAKATNDGLTTAIKGVDLASKGISLLKLILK